MKTFLNTNVLVTKPEYSKDLFNDLLESGIDINSIAYWKKISINKDYIVYVEPGEKNFENYCVISTIDNSEFLVDMEYESVIEILG